MTSKKKFPDIVLSNLKRISGGRPLSEMLENCFIRVDLVKIIVALIRGEFGRLLNFRPPSREKRVQWS